MSRCREKAADNQDHTHCDTANDEWRQESLITLTPSPDEKKESGRPFCCPRDEKQFSDSVDMSGLKFDVGFVTHHGEERVVHGVDRPDQPDHEPRRDEVKPGERSGRVLLHGAELRGGAHPVHDGART